MHHARPIAPVLAGIACVVAIATAPAARAAGPDTYALDPVHTRVMFAISHAGFSRALGTVSGSTGTLVFDRDDWRSARLDVTVPVARLDLGEAKWNAAALAATLLDGARHPQARFVSATVEPMDADHAKVCGQLTLRGVSRPLCLDVVLNALKRHPMPPFRRTAGFSATATLSRRDYGIEAWQSVIGDSVELRIEAEAVRSGPAGSAADDGDDLAPIPEPSPTEPATPEPRTREPACESSPPVLPAATPAIPPATPANAPAEPVAAPIPCA